MAMVATKFLVDWFLITLCLCSAPTEQEQIRIDIVGQQPQLQHLAAKRVPSGFEIYVKLPLEQDPLGKWVKYADLQSLGNGQYFYESTDGSGKVAIPGSVKEFTSLHFNANLTSRRLTTPDGSPISRHKNGSVLYVTREESIPIYVVQMSQLLMKPGIDYSSPSSVAMAYFKALSEKNSEAAMELIHPEMKQRIQTQDLFHGPAIPPIIEVYSEVNGDGAKVYLQDAKGLVLSLRRDNGRWWIGK